MRVLSISADRSVRGENVPGTAAFLRQKAYSLTLGSLDIVNCTLRADSFKTIEEGPLRIFPTNAPTKSLYGVYAAFFAKRLEKPDVVTAQDPHFTGMIALCIARWFGVPLHVQVHTDPSAMPGLGGMIRRILARIVLRRAARIRVVSGRAASAVQTLVSSDVAITILPIFVDVARFARATAPAELLARFAPFETKLLYVGRLEVEKNCALAIRSFKEAAPADSCLIIVGQGSQRHTLEALARELGIQGRVFFEDAQDAAPYYAIADLLLVPSKYEGYGLVIVEALAAGKPVIATDVGIAREAGAIVTDEAHFSEALRVWVASGPRTGELLHYPYTSFQQYVDAYAADLRACVRQA